MRDDLNPITELMRVVDVMTKPHTVIVDDRKGRFLGSREEQALLVKLRAAVAANIGGAGGQGAPGNHRVPLNVGASDLLNRITADIREWYGRETDYTAEHGRPAVEVTLRQWFIRYVNRYRGKQITDEGMWGQVRAIEAWEQQIRDMTDPPFRFPITQPCPLCGQQWVERFATDDPAELERVRVLNAVERGDIEKSFVSCAGCGKVWRGIRQARDLRIMMDDAETERIEVAQELQGEEPAIAEIAWKDIPQPTKDRLLQRAHELIWARKAEKAAS
jgi:hypothetical protein